MSYLHGHALAAAARARVGDRAFSSMCQAFCVRTAKINAKGDFDGDRDADAVDGWKKARDRGRVVHASAIKSYKDIPAGTIAYWSGGSRGYGHAAITIGDGRIVSTDAPSWGRIGIVSIEWINLHWGNGLKFLGYIVNDGDGHQMVDAAAPNPDPDPKPTDTIDLLTVNAGADYVPNYTSRLDELADLRLRANSSLVLVTESGPESDMTLLNKEFGWGGNAFTRRGGSAPIATSVHWDPTKYQWLETRTFLTEGTHRWATSTALRRRESGVLFVASCSHLQYLPKGPNNIPKYDYERQRQWDSVLRQSREFAWELIQKHGVDTLSILAAGDMNGLRTDPRDGAGDAAKRRGFVEAATGQPVIDRIFGRRVTFRDHQVLPTNGATDHRTAASATADIHN